MSNVLINIASEFDSKGFKQAQTSTNVLEKQAKKLGKTLLAAFSIQKITQYSKASVLAYSQDQKSAALLSNQLKNLGLAYSAVDVEKFIKNLESQTGILDDELRPAFSKLVRVTGSVAESQKLMQVAFDTSKGAGVDYMQAVDAISKAYVGNLKGLKKLNLGLTDAELKTMKFEDIVKKLNAQFGGAGAAAVNTYAGKIERLNVATANAQETIGKGFIDAFSQLAGDADFNKVISSVDQMAANVATAIVGVGAMLDKIKKAYGAMPSWLKTFVSKAAGNSPAAIINRALQSEGNKAQVKASTPAGISLFLSEQQAKSTAKILANNKKITKEIKAQTADKKAQAALDKAQAALGSAKNIFDIEKISVAAAMANTTLTENERKRLEVKQAIFSLEDAIASKDTARIETATKTLNGLTGQLMALQAQETILGKINTSYDLITDNKDLFNLQNLQDAYNWLVKINSMTSLTKATTSTTTTSTGGAGGITAASTWDPASLRWRDEGNTGNQPTLPSNIGATWDPAAVRRGEMGQPPIIIKVESKANDLVNFIYDTVTDQSASGNPPIVTRIGQNLAW